MTSKLIKLMQSLETEASHPRYVEYGQTEGIKAARFALGYEIDRMEKLIGAARPMLNKEPWCLVNPPCYNCDACRFQEAFRLYDAIEIVKIVG